MNGKIKKALQAYIERSQEKLGNNLKSVLLFGSSLHEERTSKDIDILTVVDELDQERYKLESRLELQMLDYSFDFDVTVKSLHDFKTSLEALDPFLMEVVETGRTIYGEDLIEEFKPFIEEKKRKGFIKMIKRGNEREWRYNIQR